MAADSANIASRLDSVDWNGFDLVHAELGGGRLGEFIAAADRMGWNHGCDVNKLMDAADDIVRPLQDRPVRVDRDRAAAARQLLARHPELLAGLPAARGQTYTLPAGTFFELRHGRIARVTTCYNLADWSRQVGAEV